MGELACTGNELTVRDCPFTGWGVSSCLDGLHAGVFCQSKINLHVSLSNDVQLNPPVVWCQFDPHSIFKWLDNTC